MRIGVIVFIATLLLTGCAHLDISRKARAVSQIEPGELQADVFSKLGPPDLRHDITEKRFVAFYQTKPTISSTAPITEALCTPIAFENGKVVAVGEDLTDQWTREEAARQRQADQAARHRREAEMARDARRKAEAARREKIKALEEEVRPVPVSNAALNLKLYRQLLELDPMNARYQKKVADYEARLAKQEKAKQERELRAAKERERAAWERTREKRNVNLRQYSGNGTAEMAIHDMGSGSLYVWIKNVSSQIITTHPDHFTLIDNQNREVPCSVSDSLDSVLEPGSISHGKIEYNAAIIPKTLIFQNRESGTVRKTFE